MENYLKHHNYFGSVEFSAADKILHGKIIGINDLVTYEGTTVEELTNSFMEAVDDYLETCNELGKAPDKFYKGLFNVRTSTKIHYALAVLAEKKKMKLNEVVNKAFNFLIENEDLVIKSK